LAQIDSQWQPYATALLLETMRLARDPRLPGQIVKLLEKHTAQNFGFEVEAWWQWVWTHKTELPPAYAQMKSRLYSVIDHRFRRYFNARWLPSARIRLDEVRWGGVEQDGIPPLRDPSMTTAADANRWLDEEDVVFGLVHNGEARAYPQRILAWHELFTDTIAEEPIAGVYCTLCGTMIVYGTRVDSVGHLLGTSGFLFRSNKLMYDAQTQSLWSTLWGEPVFGPLADSGIRLPRYPVVTTTWSAWRERHPQTQVLSLQTGHSRDYGEGVAYREYFDTEDLMFQIPQHDKRLRNKDEILGLLSADGQPLAIADRYLRKNPVLHEHLGQMPIVIVTDASGAHRVYAAGATTFDRLDEDRLLDTDGRAWRLEEDALYLKGEEPLPRLPAHRAFWFGWYSAFAHTRLVH
jgi:hypothetical protein